MIVKNEKPFEIVQEVNNEIPSYEEFLKTYENDGKVNYEDLNGESVGESKGYGPIGEYSWRKNIDGKDVIGCGQVAQTVRASGYIGGCTCDAHSRFHLNIECHNWAGGGGNRYACSTSRALDYAHNLEDNNWPYAGEISDEVLRKCATLVREAVQHYDRGNRVNGYVKVKGKFWGGYEWSRSY